jgi:hypothetical protein
MGKAVCSLERHTHEAHQQTRGNVEIKAREDRHLPKWRKVVEEINRTAKDQ